MGIVELATLMMIGMKLAGIGIVASWSWFKILTPELFLVGFYILISAIMCCGALEFGKRKVLSI